MASKIHNVLELIRGKHCMDASGLSDYHAARKAVNSCKCRDPFRKLIAAKSALKNYRVVVTLGPVGDVLIRDFSTGESTVI